MIKERKNKLPGLLLILALFCFAGSAEVVCKDSKAVGEEASEAQALNHECFPSAVDEPGGFTDTTRQHASLADTPSKDKEQQDKRKPSEGIQ